MRKIIDRSLWTTVAVVACPCHLPILIGVLAGTAAGAALGRHWAWALAGLVALFLVSALQAWRAWSQEPCECACD